MAWDEQQFQDRLSEAIDAYDAAAVNELIDEVVDHVRATDEIYSNSGASRILQLLRRKRFFAELERAGDALIQSGQRFSRVRRLYAQALLDQGKLTAGIAVLGALDADTADDPDENAEARGLLGRAYKQAYIDAGGATTQRSKDDLRASAGWYHGVYGDNDEAVWHGVNAVAVLTRAARDGIDPGDFPDAAVIADAILTKVKNRRADGNADAWDYATAAEACLALDRHDEALEWTRRYVDGSNADAFELAGTLRQLEEVWQLTATEDPGKRLLPYLRAELLQREGGRIDLDVDPGALQALAELAADGTYEGVLGTESFENVKWLRTALSRAASIARIETMMEEVQGTAFVVLAEDLGVDPAADGELLLLTNSHVMSALPNESAALRPGDAFINFELDELDEPLVVREIVQESAKTELDYTLFRTEPPLTDREPIPLARAIPILQERVYIIGHPAGGTLKCSIYDNRLLNHEPPYLHYRTPTKGGSSGSPVMNKNWQLIGLHHLGDRQLKLPGEERVQVANEGVAIMDIQDHISDP
jgi:hypothetical protein